MRARTSDRMPPNRNLHERVAGLCQGGKHTMTQHDSAPAEPNTWAVHFPGNLRWANAMQIVKGMAPYAAVAMDEVERVGRRLKARAALASEASGQRGNSMVRAHSASEDARERADDTRPEPGSSARAAEADLDKVWREEWAAVADRVAAVADQAAAEGR